jgi:thiamine biosynthesis lipoprotein
VNPSRRDALALLALGAAGAGAFGIASAGEGREAPIVRRSGLAFGTTVSVAAVDDGRGAAGWARVLDDAFAAIRAVQKAADLFDAKSEISRLNRDGRLDHPSADLAALVAHALALAQASGGAFDPTVQPIWQVWRDADGRPDEADLARARALVDFRAVRLADDAIRFERPGMAMTLNALAQGHAADRVAAVMRAHGVADAFLDTGEIGVRGRRAAGRPWRVGVEKAHARDLLMGRIAVADARFVATSADDRTFWRPDFSEHHIVEPWSGHSPRDVAEVVVTAASGLVADGLSTALMVTGAGEAGRRLLAAAGDAGALVIAKSGETTVLGGFPTLEG